MGRYSLLLAAILFGAAHAGADTLSAQTRVERLEQRMSSIISKAGIGFDGEFRSQMLWSRVTGEGASHTRRTDEPVEYTLVDFDVHARPNEAISGRVMFRMYQDWRNFFSDISNPIFSRWLSIDGTVKGMFSYHVGDFRARYSPLTLWSPDVRIANEPEIFARLGRTAMAEEFLGNNDRLLQGVSIGLDAELAPLFKELHGNVLGSRLRTAETSIQNGSQVVNDLEKAAMDKYLAGANLDLTALPQLTIGATLMDIFDAKNTGSLSDTVTDTLAQQTVVWAARAGVGTKPFVKSDKFWAAFDAELAMSLDDTSWWAIDTVNAAAKTTRLRLESDRVRGRALALNLGGALDMGPASVRLHAGYLNNSPEFRNELAQSPSFIGQRIMNIENDSLFRAANWSWSVPSAFVPTHYSTFDALYRQVFKFAPSVNTNDWAKAPYRKISYTRTILTQKELAEFERVWLDPAVQLVMPFGPATPNRSGIGADLGVSLLNGGIGVNAAFSSLKQAEGDSLTFIFDTQYKKGAALPGGRADTADTTITDTALLQLPATSYLQAGGGLSVDIGKLVKGIGRPIRLSGGVQLSQAENAGDALYTATASTTTSLMINAGLYANVWKRLSVLGGLQRMAVDLDRPVDTFTRSRVQQQWAAGLEYKVGEGGTLTGTVGQIAVSHSDNDPQTTGAADPSIRDFQQWQYDLHLTVTF